MLETEIERYLCMLVYEDLSAVERVKIELKVGMLRALGQTSTRSSINA
jgi:hypothetical protein